MKNVIDIKIKREIKHEVLSQRELNKINGHDSFNKVNEIIDEYNGLGYLEKMKEIEICDLEFLLNNKVLKKEEITQYSRIKSNESKSFINTVYITPFKHMTNEIYLTEVLNNPKYYQEMLEVKRI